MQMQTGTIRSAVYRDVFAANLHDRHFITSSDKSTGPFQLSMSASPPSGQRRAQTTSLHPSSLFSLLPFPLPTLLIVTST